MGQQLLPQATDLGLRSGIQLHIVQTQNQIVRLQQVFGLLGFATPLVKPSLVAQALITDAQQLVSITTNAAARDSVIDASLDKVERFEVASYRPLYICALVLRNPQIIGLIGQNLLEEEQTAALLERLAARLIPRAFSAGYPGTGF